MGNDKTKKAIITGAVVALIVLVGAIALFIVPSQSGVASSPASTATNAESSAGGSDGQMHSAGQSNGSASSGESVVTVVEHSGPAIGDSEDDENEGERVTEGSDLDSSKDEGGAHASGEESAGAAQPSGSQQQGEGIGDEE